MPGWDTVQYLRLNGNKLTPLVSFVTQLIMEMEALVKNLILLVRKLLTF